MSEKLVTEKRRRGLDKLWLKLQELLIKVMLEMFLLAC